MCGEFGDSNAKLTVLKIDYLLSKESRHTQAQHKPGKLKISAYIRPSNFKFVQNNTYDQMESYTNEKNIKTPYKISPLQKRVKCNLINK